MGVSYKVAGKEKKVEIKLDKALYPIEAIYTVCYVYLEEAYFFLKRDKSENVIVEIKPKNEKDLESFGEEFCNQLINYGQLIQTSNKNTDVKKKMLEEVFYHSTPAEASLMDDEFDLLEEDLDIDDPEDIFVPWEEKYGKEE